MRNYLLTILMGLGLMVYLVVQIAEEQHLFVNGRVHLTLTILQISHLEQLRMNAISSLYLMFRAVCRGHL